MASFERASPALKEILLRIYSAEKPIEVDHQLYEFGSVEYHIKSSASDPQFTYLSISTPLLTQEVLLSYGLSPYTMQMVREISADVLEIVEPAKEGYQLTLRLDFSRIPRGIDSMKVITEVSSVQAVILSSQLKEMLQNVNSWDTSQGMYKPIKLVYHPREPFYVIRQPQKIIAVFPMRFKEYSDVIIATSFFQVSGGEYKLSVISNIKLNSYCCSCNKRDSAYYLFGQELMDVGSSEKWAKVPPCSWSPIPPPELRGEPFEELSTNGGFVSFEISSRHIEGKRLDKTVWSLLNFYAYVKHHVKCTRGFIQRRMRKRLESLVEVLQNSSLEEDGHIKKVKGWRYMKKLVTLSSKSKILKRRCGDFTRKIKRIRFRIKIHGFGRFRRRWLTMPKFSSPIGYTKLE
ncbi:actin-related protein 2/3 complex subunit 2B isoform X1 [Herrania umbratica]|uniref:Actin-related protein 2/3 complex subunit 2B isoform X1 n=1 Tax=Herrania umbratica TaxID=108875 RepID=A0A6J1AUW3_9ROSI|nr:actin-related protein 2/3 complex subunit 2B isoform X1 [Herrania umbratica]